MRIAIATALLTLALCGTAQATVDPAWVPMAKNVAADFWGVPPCGDPTIALDWSNGGQNGAWAFPAACLIGIDVALPWTWRYVCAVMVHEYGHLWGHTHSEGGVMDSAALHPELIPRCAAPHPKIGVLVHQARRVGRRHRLALDRLALKRF